MKSWILSFEKSADFVYSNGFYFLHLGFYNDPGFRIRKYDKPVHPYPDTLFRKLWQGRGSESRRGASVTITIRNQLSIQNRGIFFLVEQSLLLLP